MNADASGGQMGTLLSHNIFAYCVNNPVNMSDPTGYFFTIAFPILVFVAQAIVDVVAICVGINLIYNSYKENDNSDTSSGVPSDKDDFLNGKPGEIKTKTKKNGVKHQSHIGKDGRADRVRHHEGSSDPKNPHTNPHDHTIDWIGNRPKFSNPINDVDPNKFPMVWPLWDIDFSSKKDDNTNYIEIFGR